MKKIDLHIHTIPTFRDSDFTYSLETFERYVTESQLDAVAVTNHDMFNLEQYMAISEALAIPVFPGIEVSLEKGHVLIISDKLDLEQFDVSSGRISQIIRSPNDWVSFDQLVDIFGDLNKYLIIPHYDKKPAISGETLEKIKPFLAAGEVDSAKKFMRVIKDSAEITPVLFSDTRIREGLERFATRQTYIDCGDITIGALKACLGDKGKVALSENDGNSLWQVFENGQQISTGLNVLLGERSSGKTHTLNEINSIVHRVKYIKQFSLVQQDDSANERMFTLSIKRDKSCFIDEYLSGLKTVIDSVMHIDLDANEKSLDQYLETLHKSAEYFNRRDAFAKTALFDEVEYSLGESDTLRKLVGSIRHVIENIEYREIIDKHVDRELLKNLACELIELLWEKALDNKKKKFVNTVVVDVKQSLNLRTSATPVEDVDIYTYMMDREKVAKFEEMVGFLKREAAISVDNVQAFRIEATRAPFLGAGEVRAASGIAPGFSDAYSNYSSPYKYLRKLLEIDSLPPASLYKLFVNIEYSILNSHGYPVSGGERSEFRLLQEIKDSQNYDMLLIDEPESSFDNLFLKSDVNEMIRYISSSMPVIVVTHNSTVGASVGADYVLYANRDLDENGGVKYSIFSGHPTDKELISIEGETISTHEIMMDSLEAGREAYVNRRGVYETVED